MNTGIGVDIGGSHIVCCGVDLETATPIPATRFARDLDRKARKNALFAAWAAPIRQCMQALGSRLGTGVGFAMPGAFNYREGIALFAGNDKYEHLNGVNVREEFAPYLGLAPTDLRFINDATAFGIGTAFQGEAPPESRLLAVTLGTGFGATFNVGGVPAMHGPDLPPHGSLWHLPFRDGIADDYFSTRWFVRAYRERTGEEVAGAREVADRAATDPRAAGVFTDFGTNLARFLGPWLERFGADRLVIGGNIARSWPLMAPAFGAGLGGQPAGLRVEASRLMEVAALIGSAKLLDDAFWKQVKEDLPQR